MEGVVSSAGRIAVSLSKLGLAARPPKLRGFASVGLSGGRLARFGTAGCSELMGLDLGDGALRSVGFPRNEGMDVARVSVGGGTLEGVSVSELSSIACFDTTRGRLRFIRLRSYR